MHIISLSRIALSSLLATGCIDGTSSPDDGGGDVDGYASLSLQHVRAWDGRVEYSAGAFFVHGSVSTGCVTDPPYGGCIVTRCSGSAPLPGLGAAVDAESVSISASGAPPISLEPFQSIYAANGTQRVASPGEVVMFRASGAELPTIETAVTLPQPVTLAAPAFGATGTVEVDHRTPLSISWSGGSAGDEVGIAIAQAHVGVYLNCLFPAERGTDAVASAALSALVTGQYAVFAVNSLRQVKTDSGSWEVHASASESGRIPGDPVSPYVFIH
jgi:hypothetical protein